MEKYTRMIIPPGGDPAEAALRHLEKEMIDLPTSPELDRWIENLSSSYPYDDISYQRLGRIPIPHQTVNDLAKIAVRIFRTRSEDRFGVMPHNRELLKVVWAIKNELDNLKERNLTINTLAAKSEEELRELLFPQDEKA